MLNNFLQNLRLQKIFQPEQTSPTFQGSFNPMETTRPMATPPIAPQGGGGGLYDIGQRMAELYQPQTQSIDRFNEMIGQYPEFEEPSKWRKFGGVALGTLGDLFGPEGSGKVAYNEVTGRGKFDRKLADWKNQIDPIKDAANIERQSNTNQRTAANQIVSNELRNRQIDNKAEVDAEKLKVAQRRAAVYEFRSNNPNSRIEARPGGFLVAINPITNQVTTLRDESGQPIASGTLTDEEKLEIQNNNTLGQIDARGDQATELEGLRNSNRLGQISATGEQNRLTRQTPNGTGNDELLPTQQRVQQYSAARQLVNTRPEFSDRIRFGPGQYDFTIRNPDPGDPEFLEIQQAIYGGNYGQDINLPAPPQFQQTNVPPPLPQSLPGNPLAKQVRNRQTGEIITVYSRDGGQTWTRE